MKRAIITGAGGFIGTHLVERLLSTTSWHLTLLDNYLNDDWLKHNPRVDKIVGDISHFEIIQDALTEPCDYLFHLAALPGGAAEQNPLLSRKVNLTATLDLFELVAQQGNCPRIIYASTIAVLGTPSKLVDDSAPNVPAMIYGTHKAMVELALADAHRRKQIEAVSIRLPGIIARPLATNGLKSAFLSNAFHLLSQGKSFMSPVSEDATMWLMSVQQCAKNLIWAAQLDSQNMPLSRALTLPALRVSMQLLLQEIITQSEQSIAQISWQPEPLLEDLFGRQPILKTPAAEKAGFKHDGNLSTLVERALFVCA